MKPALAALMVVFCPALASAGILDSALRFWSLDQTLTESRAGTGASAVSGPLSFTADRDGNAAGALDLGGSTDAVLVDNSHPIALVDFSISLWFRMHEHNPNGGRSTLFDTRLAGASYPFSATRRSSVLWTTVLQKAAAPTPMTDGLAVSPARTCFWMTSTTATGTTLY